MIEDSVLSFTSKRHTFPSKEEIVSGKLKIGFISLYIYLIIGVNCTIVIFEAHSVIIAKRF